MLHLILSEDWTVGSQEIMARIADDIRSRRGGRFLIVPELISHETERILCKQAGDTASRYAEVVTFSRLASRSEQLTGYGARECLDAGGRLTAMAAAVRQLSSRLKSFAPVETKPEFLTDLVDAVDEFKRCCITPKQLKNASMSAEGMLSQKLDELSLIMETYDAICAQGKRDPRDMINSFLEDLKNSSFAEDHEFYVDGFPDFTIQNMNLLKYFILHSPTVTVCLNCDRPGSSKLAFEKSGKTAQELIAYAAKHDIEVRIETLDGRQDSLQSVRECLFQGPCNPVVDSKKLLVYQTGSIWDEVLLAALESRKLVQQGARWRDITLVCTDPGKYTPLIRLIFGKMQIPVYQSGMEDILHETVIATVLNALDAALGGLEQQDVIRYLRSALSGMDRETCDLVENYVILWGIRGNGWTGEWTRNPEGLSGIDSEKNTKRLFALNEARVSFVLPLVWLRDRIQHAVCLSEQIEALYDFLTQIHMPEHIGELADTMNAAGLFRDAQILDQLWEILMEALEQLYDILGDSVRDPDHFTRLLKLLLSQYSVGTIPPVLDAVQTGSVTAMRCHKGEHLILLGANEGLLPKYSASSGILTDQERRALQHMDVILTGGGEDGILEEFAEIYGVICGACSSIRISCCEAQPSFVYRRLRQMAGGESSAETGAGFACAGSGQAAAWLASVGARQQAEILGLLPEYDRITALAGYQPGIVRRENIRRLYGETLRMSASQVDTEAECRMSYFLKYGLRAKERKEAQIDPAEFGTYVHDVLEHTCSDIRDMGGFGQVSLDETLNIAHRYSQAYAQERFSKLDSDRISYLFERNLSELDMIVTELWDELRQSKFAPAGFEVDFGNKPGSLPPIQIPGTSMPALLRGFVDRVDVWQSGHGNWYRIVDYKTGKKAFDYCDVYNGIGLQMLLYLFALQDSGYEPLCDQPRPAGVQYFPARANYLSAKSKPDPGEVVSERRKDLIRSGLILNDGDILQAMEPGEAPFRCYTLKKGIPDGDLADREQLKMLRNHVFRALKKIVDDIAAGSVEPNPYCRGGSHDACKFCPYGSVCHSDTVPGRRNYKTIKKNDFWELLKEEE